MENKLRDTDLSEHFTLEEATISQHIRAGHLNIPSPDTLETMRRTALKMEKVRYVLGNTPLIINSWYREPLINTLVGGSKSSQHVVGEAVDFIAPGFGSPYAICQRLVENADLIRFDQLIYEYTWVHISFAITSKRAPRGQVLTITPAKKIYGGLVHSLNK